MIVSVDGVTILEGTPGQRLIQDAEDGSALVEACFSVPTRRAMLYAENLPTAFFDVSSQQAGAILQKLRNYGRIRGLLEPWLRTDERALSA